MQDPVKIVLPLSAHSTQTSKKDKPDKQKAKTKRPKSDATQSSQAGELKAKKRKHRPRLLETSDLIIIQPGSLPPDELFQTPRRDTEVASTCSGKTPSRRLAWDQPESDDSVVSLSSASETEEGLSTRSHHI